MVDHWHNEVAGARALAVEDDHVLLAGGYEEEADRIVLLRIGGDRAQQVGKLRFASPERHGAGLVQGLGGTLHVVEKGRWTKLSVAAVRQSLKT